MTLNKKFETINVTLFLYNVLIILKNQTLHLKALEILSVAKWDRKLKLAAHRYAPRLMAKFS
ncbi:hypothetical protein LH23_14030 [Cedecea neteri]|uniref:Uncharacterized protein n=1 Tax=Cedecea neteri TaxID=158822 RepID=A0AAN0S542_9ENTR|nr:hypothetical protein LH23_14030 [Cedecea neteri]